MTTTTMTDAQPLDAASLARLMAWLSPAYPVGAYTYSHGIEWTVECGAIRDADALGTWLEDILRHGGGWTDAVLLAMAWRAAWAGDDSGLLDCAELAAAFVPTSERRLETLAQGDAFMAATLAAWPCPVLDRLYALRPRDIAYPVAVGVAAAGHGIGLSATVHAYLHAVTANLVSAGIRLIPLGQTAGQKLIARLAPTVAEVAEHALAASADDLGGGALQADIASAHHETQYSRLFRS
ncbi:MAG: urease accessory protein UreF [Alphaproteobacteria bacterium]